MNLTLRSSMLLPQRLGENKINYIAMNNSASSTENIVPGDSDARNHKERNKHLGKFLPIWHWRLEFPNYTFKTLLELKKWLSS